ncbi:MAG: AsmA-like C-terminal region-containing protein [Firmicutes bacterium]|nr:AsmA-like C-terminal region-containing protein [Bacillota bacterium]MCM1400688.1 AsmA-like C-terminal region-containing protein [Bacteroides sp.]MCM1476382.1 AsmA-like C-terminal region-containing protein [Bacteroides sp.]
MSDQPTNTSPQPEQPAVEKLPKRKRPWWARVIKWTLVLILAVVLLVTAGISLVVWTLTPERLTPLVNKYASEYLLADVNAGRVELTFWSTFPRFSVQVDSLQLTSRSLANLPDSVRSTLPSDADSLLFVKGFAGGINLTSLMVGNIELYDVDFNDIRANLVQVDSLTANYLIMPPSEPDTTAKPLELPDIALNRFSIVNGMKVRFRSPADSMDCSVNLARMELADSTSSEPLYALDFNGDALASLPVVKIASTPFAVNGKVQWQSKKPMEIGLRDFTVRVGEVAAKFSTELDMTRNMVVKSLTASIPQVELMKAVALIPEEHRAMLKPLATDLKMEMGVKLLKPCNLTAGELPLVDASFRAEASKVEFDRLNLSKLQADVEACVDCNNFNASTINVKKLSAAGKAIDFTLDALVTTPITDPLIDAGFNGTLTIQNLPSQLLDALPCTIRGTLHGVAKVYTRMSYLTPQQFHRSKIDGQLTLSQFRMAMTDGSIEAFMNRAEFKLGSSSSITFKETMVDSMLTASLTIDTMALMQPGVMLAGADLSAGVGMRNVAASSDTSQINPIGASIKAARISLRSDSDSIRIRLRNSMIAASLQRYNSQARSPLLKALVKSDFVRYADRFNRLMVRHGVADLVLHPKSKPVMSARRQHVFDSIAAAHPELSSDSIRALIMGRAMRKMAEYDKSRQGRENIDVEVDNSIRSLLRRWNANGDFSAERVRVFTPYFPSRNTLRNLDLSFSTDSVVLRNTLLTMNQSDFLLNGSVRNISRALMSRSRVPFDLDFSVKSDTIDVNDLMATMLRGAVFADKLTAGQIKLIEDGVDGEDDEALQRQYDNQLSDTSMTAVVIPSNIDARFSLKAKHVKYADLWLHGLDGLVEMFDGAVNLDRLRAYTSIGAVNFTALYSAPTAQDLSLAAAVGIRRLNLRSVLDMMPGVDSLLPLLGEVRGIVDADLALTTRLDSVMNLDLASLDMALKISGDSLQLLDNETFRTIAKWMLFKKKDKNMIDHMDVEVAIHDGYIDLYPFIFDMDRYRIGVRGSNDAAFNLDYHVAVIKSPIPFKFGINIKGTPEKMKIRLGKARINEKTVAQSRQITDTLRVNLVNKISNVFRRGVRATGSRGLRLQDSRKPGSGSVSGSKGGNVADDSFSHADSVQLIQQGLIERPAGFVMPGDTIATVPSTNSKQKKKKK